ncbi:lipase maturation factor family protein [Edaphobacter sp.]|uniref:lipase maturation factor family protein n=1 Tax=Edaphobacter sp. TaxID=1934404 RepID=UPI002DB9C647|nr:lipase maturation factor family protein [Edaphobacter sp.]HEU5340150.1 lipase maturation factor family protein [Edaphobacter sp.]
MNRAVQLVRHWFAPEEGPRDAYVARWIFLRALGLIYFSAFYSLVFQIRGLIGPEGILPASEYLASVERSLGPLRFWFAPTLLWFSSSSHMLMALCWVGIAASLLVVLNIWPRAMLVACFVCFLSFVAAAGDFSGYQSDGMLLEAGFIALFFAPGGFLPGWGCASLAPRASLFLLQWEWFRIYFESGVVKLASGDPQWRHLTAMDQYYQNGPLPTWIGWYVQHLPHWFHASTVVATFALELVIVWMLFLPRKWRIVCFLIATPWQIVVILTANYAFLNYIVLAMGFLLLDDRFLVRFVPSRWLDGLHVADAPAPEMEVADADPSHGGLREHFAQHLRALRLAVIAVMLSWVFYDTTVPLLQMAWRSIPLPVSPIAALDPFRIANQYGLFAVMTPNRYEIEFQGSNDGVTWTAYPFRYKPQDVKQPPGIYAPYQPRFDWNLWFASLGTWTQYPIVPRTEEALLNNDPDVLELFAGDPFPDKPPQMVRAVLWQYWFSSMDEKRAEGIWWHRTLLGTYAPTLAKDPEGRIGIVMEPTIQTPEP